MNWKDFFYFSRRERQGLLVLLVLLIGIGVGKFLFEKPETLVSETSPGPDSLTVLTADSVTKVETFVSASDAPRSNAGKPRYSSSERNASPSKEAQVKSEQRTYYAQEKPEIPPSSRTSSFSATEKFSSGVLVDLNQADSLTLCKVPGIGPAFSKRIISYRNLLGGYHNPRQLQEVYGMYEELYEKIIPFFEFSLDSLRKIPVNTWSLDRLKNHPYINFYQAKVIVETRRKAGRIHSVNDLTLLEEFTEKDWDRLLPYLEF